MQLNASMIVVSMMNVAQNLHAIQSVNSFFQITILILKEKVFGIVGAYLIILIILCVLGVLCVVFMVVMCIRASNGNRR
jgi:uncharacterized membrane protein